MSTTVKNPERHVYKSSYNNHPNAATEKRKTFKF